MDRSLAEYGPWDCKESRHNLVTKTTTTTITINLAKKTETKVSSQDNSNIMQSGFRKFRKSPEVTEFRVHFEA